MSEIYNQLSEFTRIARYAKYLPEKMRRETWGEQVDRVWDMHDVRFKDVMSDELRGQMDFAKQMMFDKRVLGSQRALQFGGPPILNKNARIYNCAATYVDRPRVFQEVIFSLLCGEGMGFSVQQHHVAQLPRVSPVGGEITTWTVPDSIEGWADSVGVLLSSYWTRDAPFPEFKGKKVVFDYSSIRPKGSNISHMGGKAPGPDGLRTNLEKIRNLMNNVTESGEVNLRPIDAYDILMFCSDAVLSGGVRRSATLALFSLDDDEMMKAKTGDWYIKNPQRARSNNSALLLRDSCDEKKFHEMMDSVKQFGEPGMIWSDNTEALYNPCVPASTWVLTADGWRQVSELIGKPFTAIVDGKPYSSETGFVKTGSNRQILTLTTEEGYQVRATSNHKILCKNKGTFGRKWVELGKLSEGDVVVLNNHSRYSAPNRHYDEDFVEDGDFHEGLKTMARASDVVRRSVAWQRGWLSQIFTGAEVNTRGIYMTSEDDEEGARLTQMMLLRFGVVTSLSKWDGRWRILVSDRTSLENWRHYIDFRAADKMGQLDLTIDRKPVSHASKTAATVSSVKPSGVEDVYDCTVNDIHAFDANGFYVHNCVEIGLYAKDAEGRSGIQKCNLSEINMAMVDTPDHFYDSCRAAAVMGTLQAAYTDFPYLGEITEYIVRKESLIGVSMTGMMDSPKVAFDARVLERGAAIVRETNRAIAKLIGINPAARTTCIKPSGSASCLLNTASGIHPRHARKYFRRVQVNKIEEPLKFFKNINPAAVQESVWSTSRSDDVVTFLCKAKPDSLTKNQVSALQLLEKVKLVQRHWVIPGIDEKLCVQPWIQHNVSNTITIETDEWDAVADYIWKNRSLFAGISMLPATGDMTYPQAPFQTVYDEKDIVATWGPASVFASGLIVHAHNAFKGDLYSACACLLGHGEKLELPSFDLESATQSFVEHDAVFKKVRWVAQANKFAKRYFDGDKVKMTHCLKAVDGWKTWCDLSRHYKPVDWTNFIEDKDNTKQQDTVACAGGQCEITNF